MESYIKLGDSCKLLKELDNNSVDFVLTSPPYDSIKNYNNSLSWNFDKFKTIANELYRVVKEGGVIVWVVGDQTKDGSESGTSFKQALYFKEIGFKLYDTMIYKKQNYLPLNHRRYEQEFEYMFVFSKGKPKTFSPIMVDCKYGGCETWGDVKVYKTDDDELTNLGKNVINDKKIHGNIFEYQTGSKNDNVISHPAVFPNQLAEDMINSWTNEKDIVLDPFMGSGTTCIQAYHLNRKYIGFEIEEKYFNQVNEYFKKLTSQLRIFDFLDE